MYQARPRNPKYYEFLCTLLGAIAFALAVILLSGCTTLPKAIKVATKNEANATATQKALNDKHEKVVAQNCAKEYPVAESEVIPGKEQVNEETTEQPPVVIPCEDAKGQPVKQVTCPPCKSTVRTVTRTDTIRVRDRAQERAYQLQELETQKALTKETEAHTATQNELDKIRKHRNTLLWIMGVGLVLFIGVKVLQAGLFRRL